MPLYLFRDLSDITVLDTIVNVLICLVLEVAMFFLDPLRETLDWIDSVKMEQICKQVLSSNLEVFKELLDP